MSELVGRFSLPHSPVSEFQAALVPRLAALLGGVEVRGEWRTEVGHDLYSPRLDIAVGPFATGNLMYGNEFNELAERHKGFFHFLYERSIGNFQEFGGDMLLPDFDELMYGNMNARCFMAIEIENRVSRKHLMGGAINAAALGRLGIAIGWTTDKVRAFVKLRAYLLYLSSVKKNTFNPFNLLVLSKEQFVDAVERFEATKGVSS